MSKKDTIPNRPKVQFSDLKFRVWLEKEQAYRYFSLASMSIVLAGINPHEVAHHTHRFTGRVDQNNIPIYEGDLLRVKTNDEWIVNGRKVNNYYFDVHVVYEEPKQMFLARTDNEFKDGAGGYPLYTLEKVEIVGNIYEGVFHSKKVGL